MSRAELVPLSSIAEVIRGVTFSKKDATPLAGENLAPVLRAGNIQDELILNDDLVFVPKKLISAKQRLRSGDIVMCTSSGSSNIVGKTAYLDKDWDGSFGAFCAAIRARDTECVPRYLFHYFQTPDFRSWTSNSSGINIKNIRKSELDDVLIPLPSNEEQRQIARILDMAAAICRKRVKALNLAELLQKSTFLEMFGDPVTNPKGWSRRPIGDLCTRVTVGIVVLPASYYVAKGVPALRSLNIREDYIDLSNLVFFSQEDNEQRLGKTRVWAGDVLVVRSGQPGKASIVPMELNGVNAIDILITSPKPEEVTSEYLCAFLNSPGGRQIVLSQERGQIQKHLNVGSLKAAEIPVPSQELMKQHAILVAQMRVAKAKLERSVEVASNLFASMAQRAFSGDL